MDDFDLDMRLLYYCGFCPIRPCFPLLAFNLTVQSTCISLIALDMINTEVDSFDGFVRVAKNLIFMFHGLPLLELLLTRSKNLKNLLGENMTYWPSTDQQMEDIEVQTEVSGIAQIYKTIYKTVLGIIVSGSLTIVPAIFVFKASILNLYKPDFLPDYINIALLWVVQTNSATFSFACSMMYCSMVLNVVFQLKLLNRNLETVFDDIGIIGEAGCMSLFQRNIDFHNFLLNKVRLINATFGNALLIMQWNLCIFSTLLLYEVSRSVEHLDPMSSACAVGGMYELFFLYFLPSQLLINEVSRVAESMYNSNWMEIRTVSSLKTLKVAMAMCPQNMLILAGNFVPMNMQTCTSLFKTMLTYRTYLASFKE